MPNHPAPITITPQPNGTFRLTTQLWLPRTPEHIFPFFADACNLEQITPPFVHFHVITPRPIPMHAGAFIDYRLRIRGIPLRWQTEITRWNPPHSFVDEQRKGPYRSWRHTHTFTPDNAGTLAHDQVEYAVPGGKLIHRLFVQSQVQAIFHFRQTKLLELFGTPPGPIAR